VHGKNELHYVVLGVAISALVLR